MPRIHTDDTLCRECQVCTLACSLYHEGECNLQLARLTVTKDMARYTFHIAVCQQCADAPCIAACPTEAMARDAQGLVQLEQEACIQCGACADACPYDAIVYHELSNRYLKCDFCAGRDGGPACVALCPVGALLLQETEEVGA